MFNVGEKIRQIRLERGIEQSVLAERIGVSQGFISQIERGLEIPSLKRLNDIAKALNVPVETLHKDKVLPLNDPAIFSHFDEETKRFLANEKSVPYVILAKELTEEGVAPEDIVAIKEAVKTILKIKNK